LMSTDMVSGAIERSLVERLGDVHVVVRKVSTSGRIPDVDARVSSPALRLVAVIESGARLGQPMRFVLSVDGKRVGTAVATLEVSGAAVRARRSLARDEEVGTGDVETAVVELKNVVLRRMPVLADVVGTHARRDIVAGELVTHALVIVPPAVRSGDEVRVMVTMGPVQVGGVGRASGSGQVGDMIRVLIPSNRKSLSARITGRGAVEIVR
jgi:flagella basal body P-ring formation protein FlgA